MVVLTYDPKIRNDQFPLKMQALSNMLLTPSDSGIWDSSRCYQMPMWAIDELLKHNITHLTTLCAVSLNALGWYRYAGLLNVLQRHSIGSAGWVRKRNAIRGVFYRRH